MNDLVNEHEIQLIALRRSGHHAIMPWILSNIKGKYCFLNNCLPTTNPFITCNKEDSLISKININEEMKGKLSKKDYLLYNFENRPLKETVNEKFKENHDKWLGKSRKIKRLLILRDP